MVRVARTCRGVYGGKNLGEAPILGRTLQGTTMATSSLVRVVLVTRLPVEGSQPRP